MQHQPERIDSFQVEIRKIFHGLQKKAVFLAVAALAVVSLCVVLQAVQRYRTVTAIQNAAPGLVNFEFQNHTAIHNLDFPIPKSILRILRWFETQDVIGPINWTMQGPRISAIFSEIEGATLFAFPPELFYTLADLDGLALEGLEIKFLGNLPPDYKQPQVPVWKLPKLRNLTAWSLPSALLPELGQLRCDGLEHLLLEIEPWEETPIQNWSWLKNMPCLHSFYLRYSSEDLDFESFEALLPQNCQITINEIDKILLPGK